MKIQPASLRKFLIFEVRPAFVRIYGKILPAGLTLQKYIFLDNYKLVIVSKSDIYIRNIICN